MLSSLCVARSSLKDNFKILPLIVRRNVHRKKAEKVVPVGSSFSLVYKFPHISMCSIVNKYKKFQLIAFGTGTPVAFGLHAFDICPQDVPLIFTWVGFASTVAVFAVGQLFTNLVGMAYICKDRTRVKISYLDFWGNRCDKVVNCDEVVGIDRKKLFDALTIQNDPTKYKISIRYGEICMTPLFKTALKHDPDAHLPDT